MLTDRQLEQMRHVKALPKLIAAYKELRQQLEDTEGEILRCHVRIDELQQELWLQKAQQKP